MLEQLHVIKVLDGNRTRCYFRHAVRIRCSLTPAEERLHLREEAAE